MRLLFFLYVFFVEMPTMITIQTEMSSNRPSVPVITMGTSTSTTNTMSTSSDGDRQPTAQTTSDTPTMNDVTSSSINPMSTYPSMVDKPDAQMPDNHHTSSHPSIFSSSAIPATNMYPSTVDSDTKMPSPPTMITITMDRFPSTSTTNGNTNTNTDLSTNEVRPPTYPSIYMTSSTKPDDFSYPYDNNYNYYPEMFPLYTYPMLYDSTYMPGTTGDGGGYVSNTYTPTVDYYGTTPTMTSTYGGGGGSSGIPNTASTYMGNGWSNADELNRRKNGGKYPDRDRDHSGAIPEGKYNGTRAPATVPYIRTYFNLDEYYTNAKSEYNVVCVC